MNTKGRAALIKLLAFDMQGDHGTARKAGEFILDAQDKLDTTFSPCLSQR